jgi:hypothetical protein
MNQERFGQFWAQLKAAMTVNAKQDQEDGLV